MGQSNETIPRIQWREAELAGVPETDTSQGFSIPCLPSGRENPGPAQTLANQDAVMDRPLP
jgi:hypothetical protein